VTFQRVVNGVPGDVRRESAEVYTDDVSIGTDDERSHIAEESRLFDRILDPGIRVNFSKCALGKHGVESLDHKIHHNSIRPSDGCHIVRRGVDVCSWSWMYVLRPASFARPFFSSYSSL
jgi:hypothetical protein